ncbi:hypothetical protein Hypma_005236 [Hypsizygus marmoreus]|uniref:Uncharacterized protein n=1 Tax=Hypsizygus marmoreus TaxID=39966 RepID=A0A369J8C0_HYPMA|nr:hypothetical protein Hypma_005236 [Hypsizygus marmoreus]
MTSHHDTLTGQAFDSRPRDLTPKTMSSSAHRRRRPALRITTGIFFLKFWRPITDPIEQAIARGRSRPAEVGDMRLSSHLDIRTHGSLDASWVQ